MKVAATQNLPFGDGPDAGLRDLPRWTLDVALARLRRRNPPQTPWWRRYVSGWQTFECSRCEISQDVPVYALSMAWNEDDVIYATVRNLFIQGVDKVFVVDDGSDDETALEAKAAGATVITDTSDGAFEERRRTDRIAQLIEDHTEAAGGPVWWIVVDADEFPHGPDGMTIRDLVRVLPPWVDTIGSRVLEHYPSERSAPKPRHHPLDELPKAVWHENPSCPAGHWKHQMLYVRRPGEARFMPGRHTIAAPPGRRPVVESEASLLMHHFPLRGRERTAQKFQQASAAGGRYTMSSDAFIKRRLEIRRQMLDLAYRERYDELPNMFPGRPRRGTPVRDWRDLVSPAERRLHHDAGLPL